MIARQRLAAHLLARSHGIWPINPAAGSRPPNFPEWPGGAQFAFVLTHDVESGVGMRKCRQLMELERAAGFRSCFNFIPEGDYETPPSLRQELRDEGFEIGVHDLKHDGKLYRHRADFSRQALQINHYLQAWGAVGFRSGFMHHNLEWLHDLEIEYDMSTFDTDPFEPQPSGQNTIFPFVVDGKASGAAPSRGRSSYVELPYTLPQDSTLFLVLKQRSIETWKTKLDWIAEHRGMALLDVHPDYLSFDGRTERFCYPASYYRDFLNHVKQKYHGAYWHALPKQMANFVRTGSASTDEACVGAASARLCSRG